MTSMQSTIDPRHLTYYKRVHGRRVAFHPEGIALPTHCPRGGFRFKGTFTFLDGAVKTTRVAARCPPIAMKMFQGGVRTMLLRALSHAQLTQELDGEVIGCVIEDAVEACGARCPGVAAGAVVDRKRPLEADVLPRKVRRRSGIAADRAAAEGDYDRPGDLRDFDRDLSAQRCTERSARGAFLDDRRATAFVSEMEAAFLFDGGVAEAARMGRGWRCGRLWREDRRCCQSGKKCRAPHPRFAVQKMSMLHSRNPLVPLVELATSR